MKTIATIIMKASGKATITATRITVSAESVREAEDHMALEAIAATKVQAWA
jgi:hypothetical protein